MTTFTATAYQNEYLVVGATDVNAIVTIGAVADGAGPVTTEAVEIIVCDTSSSMNEPPTKIRAARQATAAAIDQLRDGVLFAVIAGDDGAALVYPGPDHQTVSLAVASPATRQEAKLSVQHLRASGGTAMGTWLALARDLFLTQPGSIRHAILLTDGRNQSETAAHLDAVLDSCAGQFQCDARGVGADWTVAELRKIATALLGTVDLIAAPEEMADDFRAMMEQSMGKAVADATLRIWLPQGAEVRFVKQVAPQIDDITAKGVATGPQTAEYPLGAWGTESRDYHVCVRVRPGNVGDEMLAARTSVVAGDQVVAQALVRAMWTDDEQLSTRINAEVAHYTGQAELADAIQEGLEARKAGDVGTATFKLGRAVQLAEAAGNDDTKRLLAKVVDIEDAATGTVRLKRQVETLDEMALDTRSTKTVRVHKGEP
jgi:von Willebrand factor type A C-terminal domain/von Willebrand factor type A domain